MSFSFKSFPQVLKTCLTNYFSFFLQACLFQFFLLLSLAFQLPSLAFHLRHSGFCFTSFFHLPSPIFAVEGAVFDGFDQVLGFDRFASIQVRDGAGYF